MDLAARLPERFIVLELLGQGASGIVHGVFDRDRGEQVALKILHRATGLSLARFKKEFRGIADVSHENLVILHELFCDRDLWFFTMEWVRGTHFFDPASEPVSGARLASTGIRDRFIQLSRGIRALHGVGRIHRDLKPANVLVEDGGRVVVLDFGLISELREGRVRRGSDERVVGTPAYLAPEQLIGSELSGACDWYAFGCLLYEALAGAPPWAGATLAQKLSADPPPPSSLVDGEVPADLERLCMALLRRDPSARPSAEEISRVLGDVREFSAPSVAPSARQGIGELVGRGSESALLDEWLGWDGVREDDLPRVAVIEGPSGIGKSTLAQSWLARAQEAGALVFASRCHQQESVPHNAWDGIVDRLAEHLKERSAEEGPRLLDPALVHSFPVLGAVPGPDGMDSDALLDPSEKRALAVRALRALLREVASSAKLVLYVDDFQWADADSVQLFRELLTGFEPPPVRLILTHRTERAALGPARAWFVDPDIAPSIRRIDLGPLDPTSATELLDAVEGVPDAVRQDILAEAAGNPYLLAELGRSAKRLHSEGIPFDLSNVVAERTSGLSESERLLFVRLALFARPAPLHVVLRSAEPCASLEDVRRLEVAGLVRVVRRDPDVWVETYHDRLRAVVAGEVGEEQRRGHFEALALTFERHERSDSAALCVCWKAAGHPRQAASYALDAARRAERKLAFDRAAGWYDEALQLGTYTPEQRRRILTDLGRAADLAGYGARAARALREAAETAVADERTDLLRRAAQALIASGLEDAGMQILTEVLAAVGCPIPKSKVAVLASLTWQRIQLGRRSLSIGSRPHTAEQRRQLDALHVAVVSAFHHDPLRGWLFATTQLRRALEGDDELRLLQAVSNFLVFAATKVVDEPALVRAFEEFGLSLVPKVRDSAVAAWFETARGMRALLEGRWQEATERFGAAERVLREQPGKRWELTTARRAYAAAVQLEGDMGCIEPELRDWLADAERRDDREGIITHSLALGYAVLARGDTSELPALFERVRRLAGSSHSAQMNIGWVEAFWRCYEEPDVGALAAAYERLQYLHRSEQRFVAFFRAWNAGYEARVATALALQTEGGARRRWQREMRRIRRRLWRAGWSPATAQALQLDAAQLLMDGRGEEGAALLVQAAELSDRCGARLFAASKRYAAACLQGDTGQMERAARVIHGLGVTEVEPMVRAHVPLHRAR